MPNERREAKEKLAKLSPIDARAYKSWQKVLTVKHDVLNASFGVSKFLWLMAEFFLCVCVCFSEVWNHSRQIPLSMWAEQEIIRYFTYLLKPTHTQKLFLNIFKRMSQSVVTSKCIALTRLCHKEIHPILNPNASIEMDSIRSPILSSMRDKTGQWSPPVRKALASCLLLSTSLRECHRATVWTKCFGGVE